MQHEFLLIFLYPHQIMGKMNELRIKIELIKVNHFGYTRNTEGELVC